MRTGAHPGAYDVVVPTLGRPSLDALLTSLDRAHAGLDRAHAGTAARAPVVVIVDDRPEPAAPLALPPLHHLHALVVTSGGRGPAAARDAGWRRCASPWICFLDDDVVVDERWHEALLDDLTSALPDVAAVQAHLRVPLPDDRRPTDWERNVAGLASAAWITADLAVRRTALQSVGGFDPRFRRAYREDTDLALRLMAQGWRLTCGRRIAVHPVGPARWSASVHAQRGNADDALMRRLHGAGWRRRGGAPEGALRRHVATVAAAAVALAATVARRPRLAVAGATWWTIATARFAWRRIAPGPRDRREVARMLVTSLLIPPAAVWWAVRGRVRARRLAPRGPADRRAAAPPALVLFDRDGTLVVDVPYNGDPERVRPVPTAHAAVGRLRRAGVAVGIVTNQSGVARGEITPDQVDAVNRRVELLLGPFHTVQVCLHGPADGCRCRKPRAGMVEAAAAALAVDTARCAVVGDIGADVEAALAAGARAILVPTPATRRVEVDQAPEVAADLHAAVDLLLHHPPGRPRRDGAIPTTIPIITEVPS